MALLERNLDEIQCALKDFGKKTEEDIKEENAEEKQEKELLLFKALEEVTKKIDQIEHDQKHSHIKPDTQTAAMLSSLQKDWMAELLPQLKGACEAYDNSDFESAISQTMKDLSETSEVLQNASPLLNDDLPAMFGTVGLDDQSQAEMLPFMQKMAQSLLSKDILYPALKEMIESYPTWLEENKETLEPETLEGFTKQYNLMQKICIELETEKEDDTDTTKQQRFERILNLMQEMHSCIQPEELVGHRLPFFPLNSEGNPTLPVEVESPQNCNVM